MTRRLLRYLTVGGVYVNPLTFAGTMAVTDAGSDDEPETVPRAHRTEVRPPHPDGVPPHPEGMSGHPPTPVERALWADLGVRL